MAGFARRLLLSAAGIGLATIASGASAQTYTVYTNQAAFLAAAGAGTLETFTSAPVATLTTGSTFGPISYTGFTLSGNGMGDNAGISKTGYYTAAPAGFSGQNFYSWGNGSGVGAGNAGPTSVFTFGTGGTTAFGFDWYNRDGTDRYSLTIAGGPTYVNPPFSYATTGFFGVISDTAFSSASIQTYNYGGTIAGMGMDNIFVANAPSALPEPATWAMMILGVGAAGYSLRRRGKAAAKPAHA